MLVGCLALFSDMKNLGIWLSLLMGGLFIALPLIAILYSVIHTYTLVHNRINEIKLVCL